MSAALGGTIAFTETQLVNGGEATTITLTNDTWTGLGLVSMTVKGVPSIADNSAAFDAIRQDILNGFTSSSSEAGGWNNQVRDAEVVTAVTRVDDVTVQVVWSAAPAFDITANEVITCTVPASALTSASLAVATPPIGVVSDTIATINAVAAKMKVKAGGVLTHPDSTPDSIAGLFNDVTGRPVSGTSTSNEIQILGVDSFADVSIEVTGAGGYKLNGAASTTSPGIGALDDLIALENQDSASGNTQTNTTLTLDGTVSDTFTSTTVTGDVVFTEPAEDQNWESRGWYDYAEGGNTLPLANDGAIFGSTKSIEYAFSASATTATGTGTMRKLLTPTNNLHVQFYVKISSNWVGSGQTYHPHILQILDDESSNYVGANSANLSLLVEIGSLTGNLGDAKPRIRIVNDDNPNGIDFTAANDITKNVWHKFEAYFQLNTMNVTTGNSDGIIRLTVDNVQVLEDTSVVMKNGVGNENLLVDQLYLAPFIGDGSPQAQTLWLDEFTFSVPEDEGPGVVDGIFVDGIYTNSFNYGQECVGVGAGTLCSTLDSVIGFTRSATSGVGVCVTDANRSGGGGGNGARLWIGDGSNSGPSPKPRFDFTHRRREFWLRWYQRYETGFNWGGGNPGYIKLVYIFSHGPGSGGIWIIPQPSGNGWQIAGSQGNYINQLPGYTDTFADVFNGGGAESDGSWHSFELYFKMNSAVDVADGRAAFWIDGVPAIKDFNHAYVITGVTKQAEALEGLERFQIHENQKTPANVSGSLGRSPAYTDYDDIAIYITTPPNTDTDGDPFIGP